MKYFIKIILTVVTLSLFSCSEAQQNNDTEVSNDSKSQTNNSAKDLNVEEFKELIEKGSGIILDVRTPGEFSRGNIKGSRNINIAGNFSENISTLDKKTPIYLYCASGGRSSKAMQIMQKAGFTELYNLKGGYGAWTRQ